MQTITASLDMALQRANQKNSDRNDLSASAHADFLQHMIEEKPVIKDISVLVEPKNGSSEMEESAMADDLEIGVITPMTKPETPMPSAPDAPMLEDFLAGPIQQPTAKERPPESLPDGVEDILMRSFPLLNNDIVAKNMQAVPMLQQTRLATVSHPVASFLALEERAKGMIRTNQPPHTDHANFAPEIRSVVSAQTNDMPPDFVPKLSGASLPFRLRRDEAAKIEAVSTSADIAGLETPQSVLTSGGAIAPSEDHLSGTELVLMGRVSAGLERPDDGSLGPVSVLSSGNGGTSISAPPQIAAPGQPPVVQVAHAIANASADRFEIILSPEELGRVRIQLHQSESGLQVLIATERPETLDLFRKNISLLTRALSDLGHNAASFQFGERGQNKDRQNFVTGHARSTAERMVSENLTEGSVASRRPGVNGMDLRF